MSKKPTTPKRRSRKVSTQDILRLPSEFESFLEPFSPNSRFGLKPDVLLSIPEGSELRAQLYLASKIANALATFPPRIPEAREQMKELASDLAGTTFGWGLAGAIIARAQDQLLRLFPRLSVKHLHVYMAKWFDYFLDDPHLLHTEEVCTSKGHYVEVVLANILVESLMTAYRTAMAR